MATTTTTVLDFDVSSENDSVHSSTRILPDSIVGATGTDASNHGKKFLPNGIPAMITITQIHSQTTSQQSIPAAPVSSSISSSMVSPPSSPSAMSSSVAADYFLEDDNEDAFFESFESPKGIMEFEQGLLLSKSSNRRSKSRLAFLFDVVDDDGERAECPILPGLVVAAGSDGFIHQD
mmetsp:Transcript_29088/g.48081  ORF Transcript_29088/g.48081 Transcript_29088/m.48081 type:complete len:178 (+) Transcript_29088:320-853(+)|eukprot:CAMPEP_0119017358 /NCGR_PEP_ID=MMETSP1176-20130426/16326_1 /TAXON_ID=265551 /ORGANISM="Synedropsis recta cf, Strain CCMP1620" /LENGTH=177 /DNA_ID=CAMNT_0006971055 /DNA_START=286 /DNA_END=819 /DNA_ORIENTATION=+